MLLPHYNRETVIQQVLDVIGITPQSYTNKLLVALFW